MIVSYNSLKIDKAYLENANTTMQLSQEEQNVLAESINETIEIKNMVADGQRELYMGITEATGNQGKLNAAFKKFMDIVTKALDKLKSMWDKLIQSGKKLYYSYMASGLKTADKILKDNIISEFKIKGYVYSFNDDIPTNALFGVGKEFMELDTSKLGTDVKANEEYLQSVLDSARDINYNNVRASILKQSSGVSKEEFASTLFKLFRSGSNDKSEIDINKLSIQDIQKFLATYKEQYSALVKEKDKVENLYNNMKNVLTNCYKEVSNGNCNLTVTDGTNTKNMVSSDKCISLLNQIMMIKGEQIVNICNMHTIAFSSKLGAMKEACAQYTAILAQYMKSGKTVADNNTAVKESHEASDYSYNMYLINEAFQDKLTDIVFNECVGIASGTNNHEFIESIREEAGANAKDYLKKVVDFFVKMFENFKNKVVQLSKGNKNWLDSHKNDILASLNSNETIQLYTYTLDKADRISIPDYGMAKDFLSDEQTYLSKYFPEIAKANGGSVQEKALSLFRSVEKKDVKLTTLNFNNLFNFVYSYDKKLTTLNSMKDKIARTTNEINKIHEGVIFSDNYYHICNESEDQTTAGLFTYFLEADGPMTPSDVNKESNKDPQQQAIDVKKKQDASDKAKLKLYININTRIITAIMNAYESCYTDALRACSAKAKAVSGSNKAKQKEENKK